MNYQSILESIYQEVEHSLPCGKVADYIPALGRVSAGKFGMALQTLEGECFTIGDASERFSIQSISKVINLALAIRLAEEKLWSRVGIEPSGNPFDSLVQLEYEHGIPRNPFINSGALVTIDLLLDCLKDPKSELLSFVRSLGASKIDYNDELVLSEKATDFRNTALVNYLRGLGNIKNDVEEILDIYIHQCSIEMTCLELARTFLFLANGGTSPLNSAEIVSKSQAKRINAIMLTCGFYDEAGQFAYRVGLPGKSGVSGGIMAVHPGDCAIAVWSPGLNEKGNSLAGMKALELFTTLTGNSIF